MDVSSEGTVTEKANSVEQVITNVEVKESETAQRLVKLTEQAPLLEIKNLKTYFPASKNFFWQSTIMG